MLLQGQLNVTVPANSDNYQTLASGPIVLAPVAAARCLMRALRVFFTHTGVAHRSEVVRSVDFHEYPRAWANRSRTDRT